MEGEVCRTPLQMFSVLRRCRDLFRHLDVAKGKRSVHGGLQDVHEAAS
jgi:hypothetical protein